MKTEINGWRTVLQGELNCSRNDDCGSKGSAAFCETPVNESPDPKAESARATDFAQEASPGLQQDSSPDGVGL